MIKYEGDSGEDIMGAACDGAVEGGQTFRQSCGVDGTQMTWVGSAHVPILGFWDERALDRGASVSAQGKRKGAMPTVEDSEFRNL